MVNFNNKRAKLQKRRGISTIVGGAIFLVLFASAFSTFFIAMDFQQDTINTQRTISNSIMDKTQEQFAIAVSTDDANHNTLGIQVKNQGTNPVEIGNIWIVNKSGDYPATKHLIDYKDSIIPPGYGSNILQNTPLTMAVDEYDIKVVSTLGTIQKADFSVGASNNMRAELIAIPPDVKVGQNVTLTMHVENIGNSRLLNVQPVAPLPTITPAFDPPNPPAPQPVNLDPGEGAYFTWKFITSGASGTTVEAESQATATEEDIGYTVTSNLATTDIELQTPDITEIIVLNADLLARPEIFMIIPAPFGDGESANPTDKALWGANIVNPTPQEMFVSKVTITLLTPRSQSNDKMLNSDAGNYCNPETVPPTRGFLISSPSDPTWACTSNNQLTWEDNLDPQRVPPFSVMPFLAKVESGSLSQSQVDLETIVVQGNVFTTLGEFGKAGYGTSMKNNPGSSDVNVFLATDKETTASANILSNMTGIGSGSTVKFNATIADFEKGNSPTSRIDESSRLIINIPKGWSLPNILSSTGFDGPSIVINGPFADGSSQILAKLSSDLTGDDDLGRTIQFESDAPVVSSTQMYVMYILADGYVEAAGEEDFAIGPLAEVVLQVVP